MESIIIQFTPRSGTVTVISVKPEEASSFAEAFKGVARSWPEDALVVITDTDVHIEQLDEGQMRRFGWVRMPDAE